MKCPFVLKISEEASAYTRCGTISKLTAYRRLDIFINDVYIAFGWGGGWGCK